MTFFACSRTFFWALWCFHAVVAVRNRRWPGGVLTHDDSPCQPSSCVFPTCHYARSVAVNVCIALREPLTLRLAKGHMHWWLIASDHHQTSNFWPFDSVNNSWARCCHSCRYCFAQKRSVSTILVRRKAGSFKKISSSTDLVSLLVWIRYIIYNVRM